MKLFGNRHNGGSHTGGAAAPKVSSESGKVRPAAEKKAPAADAGEEEKRKRVLRRVLIVVGAIALVVLLVVILSKVFIRPPDITKNPVSSSAPVPASSATPRPVSTLDPTELTEYETWKEAYLREHPEARTLTEDELRDAYVQEVIGDEIDLDGLPNFATWKETYLAEHPEAKDMTDDALLSEYILALLHGEVEPEEQGEPPLVEMTADRKDGVYTILLVGEDASSRNTDTIVIMSFDTKNHTISATSVPRDTLINIAFTSPKKINAVYAGYENMSGNGMEGLMGEIRKILGFDVDCYAHVSLKAVEETVDAIGGVWFDVPQDMEYSDPAQDLYINIRAGYQKLNGEDAVKVCRFRYGYARADLDRIEVQHAFLKAMADQLISANSLAHIGELVDIIERNVKTDLDAGNILWFANEFLKCKTEDITFQTAPEGGGGLLNGVSFIGLNVNEWLKMINESINPYKEDVTVSNVNILTFYYNGYVGSTVGYIAGGESSFYCMDCTGKAGHLICHALDQHLDFGDDDDDEKGASGEGNTGTETAQPSDGEGAKAGSETVEKTGGPSAGTGSRPGTGGDTDTGTDTNSE